MKRTLVAYGSTHGSTREVATAIAADLRAAGHDVDLLSAGVVRRGPRRLRQRTPAQ